MTECNKYWNKFFNQQPCPDFMEDGRDQEYLGHTYRVIWLDEDKEYVGLCDEFPSLSWLSPDYDEALAGIKKLVEDAHVPNAETRAAMAESASGVGLTRYDSVQEMLDDLDTVE